MPTYVMRNGRLVPKETAVPRQEAKRVYVQSDAMPPLKHMATGQIIDSKSEFRRQTKAAGCIEVGNDPEIMRPPRRQIDDFPLRPLIEKAWYKLTGDT